MPREVKPLITLYDRGCITFNKAFVEEHGLGKAFFYVASRYTTRSCEITFHEKKVFRAAPFKVQKLGQITLGVRKMLQPFAFPVKPTHITRFKVDKDPDGNDRVVIDY
jgi:hypothetical protein